MKYKVTIERKHNDKVIELKEDIIDSLIKPRLGESFLQCCYPPIYNTIIKVEELDEDTK